MKTNYILTGALLISLVANLYFIFKKPDHPDDKCVATPGFTTPTMVNNDETNRYWTDYKNSMDSDEVVCGGVITRAALDDIMCTSGVNAITYVLCRDKSRKITGDNSAFIILSGANVQYDASDNKILEIRETGSNRFIPRHWCPPSCMKLQ